MPCNHAVGKLCIMAFFFLLCPREYCKGGHDARSAPFHLRDIDFFQGELHFQAHWASTTLRDIDVADFIRMNFNDQKNAVKNKVMGHRRSYDAVADPVRVIKERVKYLRKHGDHPDTPLLAVL